MLQIVTNGYSECKSVCFGSIATLTWDTPRDHPTIEAESGEQGKIERDLFWIDANSVLSCVMQNIYCGLSANSSSL
jgi:hypothetical protein